MTGALATINFDTDVYRRAVGSTVAFITEARGTASVSTVTYTARAFVRAGAKCTIDDVCALVKRRGRAMDLTCIVMEEKSEKSAKSAKSTKKEKSDPDAAYGAYGAAIKAKRGRAFKNCVSFKLEDEGARVSVKIFRTLAINVTGATGLSSIERVNRRVRSILCAAAHGDDASDEHAVEVRLWSVDMTQVAWFTCDPGSALDVQKMHTLAVETIDADTGPWKVASLEMRRHTALRLSTHASGERGDAKVSVCVWPCGTTTLIGKDPSSVRAVVQWISRALPQCRVTLSVPRKLTPAQARAT